MTNKITNAQMFANVALFLAENGASQELVDFIKSRQEMAQNKKSTPHKVTDEQSAIRTAIVDVLAQAGAPISISEMQKSSAVLAGLTTSRISGNMRAIGIRNGKTPNPNGIIFRSVDGKTAKFELVDSADLAE